MRVEANALDAASWAAQAGPRGMFEARAVARGGWNGDAAAAFQTLAGDVSTLLDGLVHVSGAAGAPLRIYADALEAAQRKAAEAFGVWQQGRDAALDPDLSLESRSAAAQAGNAARADMAAAREEARLANERAAQAIQALDGMMKDGLEGAQDASKAADIASGLAFGSSESINKYRSKNWMKTIHTRPLPGGSEVMEGPRVVPDEAKRAEFGKNASRFKVGGIGAAGVLGGVEQWQKDADNPTYSSGERVGRAAGAGMSLGAPAAAGAAIGSIVPGGGTVVGALAGLAVGAVAGYYAGELADDVNDPLVDQMGDAGDWVGDNVDDITPW